MKYLSLATVAVMMAAVALVGCAKKDDAPQAKSERKLLNPPKHAPKTVLVQVPANGDKSQARYLELNQEVTENDIERIVANTPANQWKQVSNNQMITQQQGYQNGNMMNDQRYFVQNPNTYVPNNQQPMGQNPYTYGNPYQMGNYYSQQNPQMGYYPGVTAVDANSYYYAGGVYAPYWGYGNGGYGYAYGYGYGYYGYPNYYGGCGTACNHYYPYYYYPTYYYPYSYQPCYYYGNSYWYYYGYGYYQTSYYNYYAYAGWWY